MPSRLMRPATSPAERSERSKRYLLLLASGVLLVLALSVVGVMFRPPSAHARPTAAASAFNPHDATITPPVEAPTDTPVSATHTPVPKATSSGNGADNQEPSPIAQPSPVANAQPTVGAGASVDATGLPGASGPNGMQIAVISSCVTTILGLIVSIVAYRVLIRGGYGPFLRMLFLGKRASRRSARASSGRESRASRSSRGGYDGRYVTDDRPRDRSLRSR